MRAWTKETRLHAYKLGGEWRISEEDLEELLASSYTGNKLPPPKEESAGSHTGSPPRRAHRDGA